VAKTVRTWLGKLAAMAAGVVFYMVADGGRFAETVLSNKSKSNTKATINVKEEEVLW
jgi:hypothetical protein